MVGADGYGLPRFDHLFAIRLNLLLAQWDASLPHSATVGNE
jgi:hypothetical protein